MTSRPATASSATATGSAPTAPGGGSRPTPAGSGPAVRSGVALAALAVGFAVVAVWGKRLDDANPLMFISASPWIGRYAILALDGGWIWLVPPAVLAAGLIAWWPAACNRLPAHLLAPVAGLVGVAWAVALQATRGWFAVTRPLAHPAEYLAAVDRVGSPGRFLQTFVEQVPTYPIHVQSHPPGQVLLLWTLDRVGLGGTGPASVLTFLATAVATAAVLTVVRWEAGLEVARRAAVFVGLTPAVIWVATSTDPVFAGLAAASVVLAFAAERAGPGRPAAVRAALAGLVAGLAVLFTYAAPLFLAPALVPAWRLVRDRRWVPVAAAVVAGVAPVALTAIAGFNLLEGWSATAEAYWGGVADHRPYRFFVVANPAILGVALGPAVVAGLARGRSGRLTPLLALAGAAVAVANLTGLSKGEVERIWFPLMPWLAVAAAPLATSNTARLWLASQLATAATIQVVLRSPW